MNSKGITAMSIVLACFTAYFFISSSIFGTTASLSEDEKYEASKRNLPQVIWSVNIEKGYEFSGEALPMENFDVRERLDRELTVNAYWHSSTILNIKNANKYFPVIEPILMDENVPDDFKYLAVAESNLRNATSPAGAKGIWQFMPATAKMYGLEVNSEVDERYHIEKSTRAACQLLKDYYKTFGTWTLAAAAYNVGIGNLQKEIELQHADSYYDLNLNAETSRYIFRLVAIKEIITDPGRFGFFIDPDDLYKPLPPSKSIVVEGNIESIGSFASQHGTSYRMVKVYNPWLMTNRLTNRSRKQYKVRIPRDSF